MKRSGKMKLLSVLMAAALVFGAFPSTALAVEPEDDAVVEEYSLETEPEIEEEEESGSAIEFEEEAEDSRSAIEIEEEAEGSDVTLYNTTESEPVYYADPATQVNYVNVFPSGVDALGTHNILPLTTSTLGRIVINEGANSKIYSTNNGQDTIVYQNISESGNDLIDPIDVYYTNIGTIDGRKVNLDLHVDKITYGNRKTDISSQTGTTEIMRIGADYTEFGDYPGLYEIQRCIQFTVKVTYADGDQEEVALPFYEAHVDLDQPNTTSSYYSEDWAGLDSSYSAYWVWPQCQLTVEKEGDTTRFISMHSSVDNDSNETFTQAGVVSVSKTSNFTEYIYGGYNADRLYIYSDYINIENPKKEVTSTGSNTDGSYAPGDVVSFTVTQKMGEQYVDTFNPYTSLVFRDTIQEGLTYVEGSAKMYDGDADVTGTAGEVAYDSSTNTLTYTFNDEWVASFDTNYRGQTLKMTFECTVDPTDESSKIIENTAYTVFSDLDYESNTVDIPVKVPVLSIEGIKEWDDEDDQDGFRPTSIDIYLLADGVRMSDEHGNYIMTKVEPDDEGNWTFKFTDLPKFTEDGEEIQYSIEEVSVDGYETTVPKLTEVKDPDTGEGTGVYTLTITNKHKPEKINISGEKVWDDANNQDGKRPASVTVNLLADGEPALDENGDAITATLKDDNNWAFSFTELPKYKDGKEIQYNITEDAVDDYSTEITITQDEETGDYAVTVTNSYTPEQTSLSVIKVWEDENNQDGIRPKSITVSLLANGDDTGKTLTLDESNNWQGSFEGLDVYTPVGQPIEYTIEEISVNEYVTAITQDETTGFVITNTHKPETVDISGTKTWEDNNNQDGVRPASITIRLWGDGAIVETKTITPDDEGSWSWSFTGLPKYNNGKEIVYNITEDIVPDYSTTYSEEGYDVTNRHTPDKTSLTVLKVWNDNNDEDGVRPDDITVTLVKNDELTDQTLTLSEENSWTGSFTDLDVYTDGEENTYTVQEETVADYETRILGNATIGYVIVNEYKQPVPEDPEKSVDTNEDGQYEDDGEEVNVGDELTYKISYYNHHSTEATVTITDVLDEGLDFVSATDGGTYDKDTRTITWVLEGVAAESHGYVQFTATVNETALIKNEVVNTASVQIGTAEAVDTNTVENPLEPDYVKLTIGKEVAGESDTTEYEFEITLTKDGEGYDGNINTTDADAANPIEKIGQWFSGIIKMLAGDEDESIPFENGVGTVTVTAGESVTLLIPSGWDVKVTEKTTGADSTTVYDGDGNVIVQVKGTDNQATANLGTIVDSTQLKFVNSYRSYFPIDEEIVTDEDDIFDKDAWVKEESVNEYNAIEIEMTTNLPVITAYDLENGAFTMNFHNELDHELVLDEETTDFKVYIGEQEISSEYYKITFDDDTGDECNFHVDVYLTALYKDGIVTEDMLDGNTEITIFFFADLEGTDLNGSYTSTVKYDIYDGDEWLYTSNESVIEVYTYEIEIVKYDSTDEDLKLAGAVFGIYYDEDCTEENAVSRNGKAYTAVSDEDGVAIFYGLAEGTYYVKELEAPDGYQLSDEILTIDLNEETADEEHIYHDTFADVPEEPEPEKPNPVKSVDTDQNEAFDDDGVTVHVGDEVTYKITYNNYNDEAATVVITDELDKGVDFESATDEGVYDKETHTITWTLENVEAGYEGYVTFTATVNENALVDNEVDNTASVKVGDNNAQKTNTVENPVPEEPDKPKDPEKSVDVGDGTKVQVGDELTYTITYYNHNADTAIVTITDTLDDALDFVSATDGGVYDEKSRTVTWTIKDAPAMEEGTVSLTVKVNDIALLEEQIENTATVKIGNDKAVDTNMVKNPTPDNTEGNGQPGTTGGGNGGPKTGDTNNIGLWIALLVAAMAAVLVALRLRKRS